jgi:uncharacterized delta-60 repeat protein
MKGPIRSTWSSVWAGAALVLLTGVARADGGAGALDATFGTGGVVAVDVPANGAGTTSFAVATDGWGRAVVAGQRSGGGTYVRRLLPDGSADATFGSGGVAELAGHSQVEDVAVDALGRVVLAEYTTVSGLKRATIARLTAAGTLDATFGSGGLLRITTTPLVQLRDVLVLPDGRILAAGYVPVTRQISKKQSVTSAAYWVLRCSEWGVLDTTFDGDGVAVHDLTTRDEHVYAGGSAVQADGKIVLGGRYDTVQQWALVRLLANGALDTGFGVVTSPGDVLGHVVVDSSDRVVAAGWCQTSATASDVRLRRHLAGGSPDASFGTGGTVSFDSGSFEFGKALAVQSDGKIVVATEFVASHHPVSGAPLRDLRTVRWLADGSLDTAYGTGGVGVALQAADHLLVRQGNSLSLDSLDRAVVGAITVDYDSAGRMIPYSQDGVLARISAN